VIQNESSMNQNLNNTKTSSVPSHEAVMSDTPDAVDTSKTVSERLDQSAMQAARRAQNRIHINEERSPESTIFTK